MKVNQKLLGVALITALGILSLPKEGIAGTSLNGISLNGTSLNGTSLNGTSLNGTSLNGTSQGTKLESANTGLTLSSPDFAGVKVEGGRLVGVK